MTNSIPASQIVQVVPGVLDAGGNPLALNAVFVTTNDVVPIGALLAFATLEDVQDYFGAVSDEATLAAVYFSGYENKTTLPNALYFWRWAEDAVAGWLRGGSLAGGALAAIQALSGVITIVVDGRTVTSDTINLSGATSFSNAADLVETGLNVVGGIFGGTGAIAGTTLTISAAGSGALHVGDVIDGSGVTAGTEIVEQLSGTPGGVGTYEVSASQTVASTTITVTADVSVSYSAQLAAYTITSGTEGVDSAVLTPTTNSLTTGLKLTAATGRVLSAGADATTPASTMAGVVAASQNWATFMTVDELALGDKVLFAQWAQTANDRYMYVVQDSDVTALLPDATASFGYQSKFTYEFSGVATVYDPDGKKAAFICGVTASIDFARTNGRISYAFKGQSGLTADVTDATSAANLTANGYNFYGSYATANDAFQFLQNGQISGAWLWVDEFVNQIYLNNQLQLAFMTLLSNQPSIPYNPAGYNLIRAAAQDPINEALNFGTIRPGVPLTNQQAATVNSAAGFPISDTLSLAGYYFQIVAATGLQRQNRESPSMTLWYMSGGSVQKITLASIDVL